MPETHPKPRTKQPAARRKSILRGGYAELHCRSNFTFLEGASHAEELAAQAAELGHAAIAITDRNSLAGVVRAHVAAKAAGIKLLVGAEITPVDAPPLVVWCPDRKTYGRLARLLTVGRRAAEKGECRLTFDDVAAHAEGLLAGVLLRFNEAPTETTAVSLSRKRRGHEYRDLFGDRCYAIAELHRGPRDRELLQDMMRLARDVGLPLVAANAVHYHCAERRPLQDVLTAIRHGCTVAELGERRFPNAERRLKSPGEMLELFAECPEAVARTVEIAERCTFSLDELRYEYPEELAPPGMTPLEYLTKLTWEGAREKYSERLAPVRRTGTDDALATDTSHCGVAAHPVLRTGAKRDDLIPDKVRRLIEHELQLIAELRYEAYFLTVWDLVRFARSRDILCQGRGSAANSAVCYCLGVTSVDPERIDVLFERFVSKERNEAPDIDVDFEHERREEVLQYLYDKYGRDRAGMTAEVISYRGRSAVRDIGKALGLSLDRVDALSKALDHYHVTDKLDQRFAEAGVDARSFEARQLIALVEQIVGFPRHLSQHVGGMVMTQGPLCELVPIENAAMPDRTVVQWDKDDLDALGILKVDCLALGMLTAIHKCFDLVSGCQVSGGVVSGEWSSGAKPGNQANISPPTTHHSPLTTEPLTTHPLPLTLATIPAEDPEVYAMCSRADTVGVFQIESRAQMAMLPRLRPEKFYDLVIEVAIVRPGPIQGDMVHPYLRRRNGEEKVEYPDERIKAVLEKTLGVPLFQEQAMRLAVVAAGFTPGEADQLRRAMAAWRRKGGLDAFQKKLTDGMKANGYSEEFAERLFRQIRGFGEYGFPESHAASFALLVYVSAWLKCYYPAAFAAALINSQPMGFYAPAQLISDAQKHGVQVRPADVNCSAWDCTLEPTSPDRLAPVRRTGRADTKAVTTPSDGDPAPSEFSPSPPPRGDVEAPEDNRGGGEGRGEGDVTTDCRMSVPGHAPPSPPTPLPPPRCRCRGHCRCGAGGEGGGLPVRPNAPALRLGLRLIAGLPQAAAETIMAARGDGRFTSFNDFVRRTRLGAAVLQKLALADAFHSLGLSRREALWQALPQQERLPLFDSAELEALPVSLPPMSPLQETLADYSAAGLTLRDHPVSFLRAMLDEMNVTRADQLLTYPAEERLKVAGLVLLRQRPATASGITFVTLEDETGIINLIVRPQVWERCRRAARASKIMLAHGRLQRQGEIIHVLVTKIENLTPKLAEIQAKSRDFR